MVDKEHSDTQEKIETITYDPELQDSGDLEAATKTITATSKPGTADYSANLTIPAPPSRVVVTKLALRGNIHIDSFGGAPTATKLYCTVECNGVEKVSAKELTSAGADNFLAADLAADFNLGSANELKVYLWADQGNAVISVCQLWLAWGSSAVGYGYTAVGQLSFKGFVSLYCLLRSLGSGSANGKLLYSSGNRWYSTVSSSYAETHNDFLVDNPRFGVNPAVNTDIGYYQRLVITLRSSQ